MSDRGELPRERILAGKGDGMLDEELLAVLLSTGAEGSSNRHLARLLLEHFGSLKDVLEAGPGELLSRRGVGPAKAARLLAAAECRRRMNAAEAVARSSCPEPEDLYDEFLPRLGYEAQEHLVAIFLDARGRRFGHKTLCIGGLYGALVHPRDVFRPVMRAAAAGVILLHNHPSGSPEPSEGDIKLTARMESAGLLLGIRVLDHVIIGTEGYRSLRQLGHMTEPAKAA